MFDNASFFIRNKEWRSYRRNLGQLLGDLLTSGQRIGGDCEAIPTNLVRYDSPVFAGFSVSADWGQNGGYWDAYARYAGEWNGIKIAATSGWGQDNTANLTVLPLAQLPTGTVTDRAAAIPGADPSTRSRLRCWLLAVRHLHRACGNRLFVYGAYGREFMDTAARLQRPA